MLEDLSPMAKKIYEAMKKVGASSEDKLKTADDIMKASNVGKGIVNNCLLELVNKGYIKRIVRQKSAGYYIIK
jgi:predicted transcriptional regulator